MATISNPSFPEIKQQRRPIAGAVILYNSSVDVIDNINSYIGQVERLYVIDNSDQELPDLVRQFLSARKSIRYITNAGNLGVAYALNKACIAACEEGFSFLLTMDDDSLAPKGLVERLYQAWLAQPNPERVGIVSVQHQREPDLAYLAKPVRFTMTSGNLLNLQGYRAVGPFLESLFIDHVDHEYGLRLATQGYQVLEVQGLRLNHRLGMQKVGRVLGVKVTFVSHNPVRLYYLVRNGLYVSRQYVIKQTASSAVILWLSLKEVIKSILLEDQRPQRIGLLAEALRDGLRGNLGKR
ncbi:glycosyltransferase family 2 protein [Spirosoma luteolum]